MTHTLPWYGVTTDGSGHVTWLNLNANWLAGWLTPEMFSWLIYLEDLELDNNQSLKKISPYTFSSLINLKNLSLFRNHIMYYDRDVFGWLYNLESLTFGDREPKRLEQWLFRDLHNLKYLYF